MAVVTVQRFKKAYPEFKATTDELVQQKLNHADENINDNTYGDEMSIQATMALAAHFLSISPSGESARIWVKGNQTTMYMEEYRRMMRTYTMGKSRVS